MLGFAPLAAAPLGAIGKDGSFYNASFNDSVSAGAAFASQAVLYSAYDAATTISDAAQIQGSTFASFLFEGVTLSDSASVFASFPASMLNAVSAVDSVAAKANFAASSEELLTGSDNLLTSATLSASALDSAGVMDLVDVLAVFAMSVLESSEASEDISASSIFPVNVLESALGEDFVTARMDFVSLVTEIATGEMSALVGPSIFNAQINEMVQAFDLLFTTAMLYVTITDGAVAMDQLLSPQLWEIIDDAQNANWADVNDSQSTSWGIVDDGQPTNWHAVQTQN